MPNLSDKELKLIASITAANQELQREIKERKEVEICLRKMVEELQKTSLQLRTLINAMPDIVCFKNGRGKWIEANQAMLELFELEELDYQGKSDAELAEMSGFYRDALLTCQRSDRDAWKAGVLSRGEEAIAKPDGTVKIYDVIKVPLFHPDGSRNGLVVLGRDITERKQAEKTCLRLASIVDSSDDAIVGNTLAGIIYSWNPGAEQIYGYTASEVKGQCISILTVPDRPNEIPQILENIAAGASIERYETMHLRKDGKRIDVSLTMSPIKGDRGEVIGVSTIAQDISDRKQVEIALEQLRYQNQLILECAGDGICGLDRNGKITFSNPASALMTGYSVKELVNSDWGLVSSQGIEKTGTIRQFISSNKIEIHQKHKSKSCQISGTLQRGIVCHVTDEVFWRKDGSSFPVEYVSTPIQRQGEIIGAVITFKDITERLAIEQMKDEFISVVSHELRTPLASIHGALGLLESGRLKKDPEKGERMLDIAVANTNRLVRLISDILDLERLHSHQVTMVKQICNVAELMVTAVREMQPIAEKAGVILSVSPIDASLWGCSDRLIQVLTNLLSNAIKFSSKGGTVCLSAIYPVSTMGVADAAAGAEGASYSVSTGGSEKCHESQERSPQTSFGDRSSSNNLNRSGKILIAIKDRGRGIPADKLESIFGRFQQVDASDSRQKGGTGLGLAICRSIVEQHGGRIWAESSLGQGSTFFLALPIFIDFPSKSEENPLEKQESTSCRS